MMKKLMTMLLTFVLLCCVMPSAFAASGKEIAAANTLHELGLFAGVVNNADGTPNYDLDRTPTRSEAITMLVRLLGKETEAKEGVWETPFIDVASWAKPYVGYAYVNKLTSGTSETTFGGDVLVNAMQYLTFVLRALGYESGVDFQWDRAWELSDALGMTSGEYNAATNNSFLRGSIADISLKALPTALKNKTSTLAEKLVEDGVFTQAELDKALVSNIGTEAHVIEQVDNPAVEVTPVETEPEPQRVSVKVSGTTRTISLSPDSLVWIPATGEKFHAHNSCGRMNPSKAHQITVEKAKQLGYEACEKCY